MNREQTWRIIREIGWKKRKFDVAKTARKALRMFDGYPSTLKEFLEEVDVFRIALSETILQADKTLDVRQGPNLQALVWHYIGLGRKAFEEAYEKPKKALKRYRKGEYPALEESFRSVLPRPTN